MVFKSASVPSNTKDFVMPDSEIKDTSAKTIVKRVKKAAASTARRVSDATKKTSEGALKEVRASYQPPADGKDLPLTDPELYINRDISWIEFDRKVLETAEDPQIPLLNRVMFLSIFFNNLDEFFMVRVMNVQKQDRSGVQATGPDKMPPSRQIAEIRRKVDEILEEAEELWNNTLKPELAKKGIHLVKYQSLTDAQKKACTRFFEEDIFPVLTPQAVDKGRPFPMISNTSLNFVMELEGTEDGSVKSRFARLKCPNNVPRFLFISNKDQSVVADLAHATSDGVIILVEDLIGNCLNTLFPGYRVKSYGLFRITRNTDGEIEEDEADDLLSAVRDYVEQRRFGSIVRLELERGMPQKLQNFLFSHLDLAPNQIYRYKMPLAFSEFVRFMKIDRPGLKYPADHPKTLKAFDADHNCFDEIRKRDIMVYHPYDSFNCVLDFLKRAARDPNVVAIKQTLYRCGSDSPVAKYLLEARRLGKQVTAVVELKARFDEEQNINWAEELERNGVNVVYGFAGLKIHAKLCFVVRREKGKLERFTHIGSGNYNAASARIYTDLGLFTASRDINDDVQELFNVMTGYGLVKHYRKLLVSPHTLRTQITSLIRREIETHKKHGNGHIILKCNQLVDAEMVQELYAASRAGVKIECIVRGICSLRPGIPGVSETISVRSVVGRLLEHARIYWFHNNGASEMYFGSADLMTRNLNGRIEVLTPVLEEHLRRNIMEQIVLPQLKDNVHAWIEHADGSYTKMTPKKGEKVYDSQEEIARDLNLMKK